MPTSQLSSWSRYHFYPDTELVISQRLGAGGREKLNRRTHALELEGPEFKPRFVYFVSYVALHYSATLSPCVLLVGIRQDLMQPNEVPLYLSVLVPSELQGSCLGLRNRPWPRRVGRVFTNFPHMVTSPCNSQTL